MTLTFQREAWAPFVRDAKGLWDRHWAEVAVDRDTIGLAVNEQKYADLEAANSLIIITARVDGSVVGYFLAFIFPHFHYQDAGLMAITDVYYLAPDHRHGMVGLGLLTEAERAMRDAGAVKAYLSCKVDHDHTSLFELLGWRLTDYCFTKRLGG